MKPNILRSIVEDLPICDYIELDSTNAQARRLVDGGERNAFVVSTKKQTNGRGRFNRVWQTPENNVALTISVPRLNDYLDFPTLSLMTGLAIHEVLSDLIGLHGQVRIKWPNDILVSGAKVSGTLIESNASWLYVGIGINLAAEPEGTIYPTTSLRRFCDVERIKLIETVVERWRQHFDVWSRMGFKPISEQYSENLWRRGEELKITLDADRTIVVKGYCVGVDDRGFLLLDVAGQGVRAFSTGDVGA